MVELIKEVMQNPVLSTTAVMALLGSIFYSAREVPKQLLKFCQKKITMRLIYKVTIYQYDDLYDIFEKWLVKNYSKQYRDVQAYVSFMCGLPDADSPKEPKITYRQAPNVFTIKVKGKLLAIQKSARTIENAQSFSNALGYYYTIQGFNAKGIVEMLLEDIVKEHWSMIQDNEVRIYSNYGWGEWKLNGNLIVKDLDRVILGPEIRETIKSDLEQFKDSQVWYESMGIPWKRTILFHGPPGTGKTTLVKAIAMYIKRDLYSLNLGSVNNDSALQTAFSKIPPNALLLLEDIDAAFNQRNTKEGGFTFSFLLNCMDGVFYQHGLITCITTNHLDRLDPALLRPGRTDQVIEIGYPAFAQINEYLSLFYEREIDIDLSLENTKLSMGAVQEICLSNRNDWKGAMRLIRDSILIINRKVPAYKDEDI